MGGRGSAAGKSGSAKRKYQDYDDRHDSNAALSPDGEAWWSRLNKKERDFYKYYTLDRFRDFNKEVRKADGDVSKMKPLTQSEYQIAVNTLGNGVLDRDMVMHRNSSGSLLGLGSDPTYEQIKAMEGKIRVDYSITSSRASKYAETSSAFGKIRYHINTPKGKGIGAYIANHSSCGEREDEFLYRPGSAFRIDKVYLDKNGRTNVDMTYVGNINDAPKKK